MHLHQNLNKSDENLRLPVFLNFMLVRDIFDKAPKNRSVDILIII